MEKITHATTSLLSCPKIPLHCKMGMAETVIFYPLSNSFMHVHVMTDISTTPVQCF